MVANPWSDERLCRTFDDVARSPDAKTFAAGIGDADAPSRIAICARLGALLCRSVLDVGCGPGVFMTTLDRRASGIDYCGIDPSPTLIAEAEKRTHHLTPRFGFGQRLVAQRNAMHCLALDETDVAAGKDAVILRHVLEHVGDDWPEVLAWSLSKATRAAFVAVSVPMLKHRLSAVESDRFLGLRRWALPFVRFDSTVQRCGWSIAETVSAPAREVVPREELFVLRPKGTP